MEEEEEEDEEGQDEVSDARASPASGQSDAAADTTDAQTVAAGPSVKTPVSAMPRRCCTSLAETGDMFCSAGQAEWHTVAGAAAGERHKGHHQTKFNIPRLTGL